MTVDTSSPASDSTRRKRLGELAVERGLLTASQLEEALANQARLRELGLSERIGTVFSKKKLLSAEIVQELLREQAGGVRRLGNFEIGEKIGQGAMGVVFKARQISMDRTVALKILAPKYANDPTFIERFVKEARAAGQFNHEHIVTALDVGYVAPYHYFAMEYVEGRTLGHMLKERGALPEREALTFTLHVAQALGHALGKKIIHRDVKPENIMVTPAGMAKLLDLGLACAAGADTPEETSPEPLPEAERKAVGTPHYMSPEAARGEEDLDTRSDLYSLGCTLYHLLTNHTPFEGNRSRMIMALHLTEEVPDVRKRNPRVTGWTARIVGRMTAKERADRYADPSELIEDLNQVLAGKPPLHAKPETSGRSGWKGAATTGPRAPVGSRATTGPRAPVSPRGTTGPRAAVQARTTTGPAAPIVGDRTGALEPAGHAAAGEAAHAQARTRKAPGAGVWIGVAAGVLAAFWIALSLIGGGSGSTGTATARNGTREVEAANTGTNTSMNTGLRPSTSTTTETKQAGREERARAAMEEALQLERRRPEELGLQLAAWEHAREQARETAVAAQAGEAWKAAQARWAKALDGALQERRVQTEAALGKEDFAAAWAALESNALPASLKAADWEARLGLLRVPVREAAEGAAAKLLAGARARAGEQNEAGWEAALELARKAEGIPAQLSASAAQAVQERAKWTGELEAWRKARAAEQQAKREQLQEQMRETLAAVRKEMGQLIRQQRLPAAQELLEKKMAGIAEAQIREALAREKGDLEALCALRLSAAEGLRKQAGKTVSLQKGNSTWTGVIQNEGPGNGVSLKLGGGASVMLSAEQLSVADVDQYAPAPEGAGEVEGFKQRGLLWMWAGESKKAREYFEKARAAGLGDAVALYLERVETMELGENEFRAKQEWGVLEASLKEAALKKGNWKEIRAAAEAFKARFGATEFHKNNQAPFQALVEKADAELLALEPPLQGLKVWLKLDEGQGTLALNAASKGMDAEIKGASWAAGKFGGALRFNGNDQWALSSNVRALFPTNSVTIAVWINPAGEGVVIDELGQPTPNAAHHDSNIEVLKNGEIRVRLWPLAAVSLGVVEMNKWSHAILRYDHNTTILDGFLNGTKSTAESKGNREAPGALFYALGIRDETHIGSGTFYNGQMDDVRIYDRALSDDEAKKTAGLRTGTAVANAEERIDANPGAFKPGLVARIFKGQQFRTDPLLTRIDAKVDFDWGNGGPGPNLPNDQFCMSWCGAIKIVKPGHYTFATVTDDGARLWIQGKPVIDQWTGHPPERHAGEIDLPAGIHEIKLEYFEGGGGATCRLLWSLKDGFNEQVIPAENLWHSPKQAQK